MQPQTAAEARGTGREGAEHPGCLSHILTCSSSSSGQQSSLHRQRGGKGCPPHLCWVLSGLHSCFKEVFIFCQFSSSFLYKQNLCLRSITPTDVLWFSAKGRMNPKSRDWWEFLFPYLPLIQRACSPWSLMSLKHCLQNAVFSDNMSFNIWFYPL